MDIAFAPPALALLAGIADGLMPTMGAVVLAAGAGAGAAMWFAARRWVPAVQRLTTTVERELGRLERIAARSAKAPPDPRQPQPSVREAMSGVQALRDIMDDLDHHTSQLRHLAHRMAERSEPGLDGDQLVRQAASSAEHLARTVERTRQTYRLLSNSLGHMLHETDDQREREEAVREEVVREHARVLTGALNEMRSLARTPRMNGERAARSADARREGRPANRESRPADRRPDRENPPTDRRSRDERPVPGREEPRRRERAEPRPEERDERLAPAHDDRRARDRDADRLLTVRDRDADRRAPFRADTPGYRRDSGAVAGPLRPTPHDRAERARPYAVEDSIPPRPATPSRRRDDAAARPRPPALSPEDWDRAEDRRASEPWRPSRAPDSDWERSRR